MALIAVQGTTGSGKTHSIKGFTELPEKAQSKVLFIGSQGELPFKNSFTNLPVQNISETVAGTDILDCLRDVLGALTDDPKAYKVVIIDSLTDVLKKEEANVIATSTSNDLRQAYKVFWDRVYEIMDLLVAIGSMTHCYCMCTSGDVGGKHKILISGKHGELGIESFFTYVIRTLRLSESKASKYIKVALKHFEGKTEEEVFPAELPSPYAEFYHVFKTQSTYEMDTISYSPAQIHQLYVENNLLNIHKQIINA